MASSTRQGPMQLSITRGENGVDAHPVQGKSRRSVSTIYTCVTTHLDDETQHVPFDPPRSSWRLITTFQQSTSIGRSPNVTPSIRGMETRRQDSTESPLSSFPGRQASFRSRGPVSGIPQLHRQATTGFSIGRTLQELLIVLQLRSLASRLSCCNSHSVPAWLSLIDSCILPLDCMSYEACYSLEPRFMSQAN